MAMLRSLMLLFLVFSMGNAEVNLSEKCPYGWTNFGFRCFKFYSQSVNWITAEKNCQSLDANLASVHSKMENDFLLSLLPSPSARSWLGGHDGEQESQWFWSDGTVFDYTYWNTGEPNNGGGVENCLEISYASSHFWNDIPCSSQMNYICVTDL